MDLAVIIGYIAIFNLLLLCVFFSIQTHYKKIAFYICYNMIGMALTILGNLLIYQKGPEILLKILFPLVYLMVYGCSPHFYFIINRLLDDEYKPNLKNPFHYIPIIISVSFFIWYYLQSSQFHADYLKSLLEFGKPLQIKLLDAVFVIQSIIYTGICYRRIYVARKATEKNKNAKWLWKFINFIIIASAILFPIVIFYPSAYMIVIINSIATLIYYFALIFDLFKFRNNEYEKLFNKLNIQTGSSNMFSENDTTISIANKIDVAIHKDKIFKNKFLTVSEFSIHCNLPQYIVSQFLTNYYSKSFNEFINDFRVEEAIRILNSTEKLKYSVEIVGQICGFNSRSAFYNAFKRCTGYTPRQYLVENLQRENSLLIEEESKNILSGT